MVLKQKVRKQVKLLSDFDIYKRQGNAIVSAAFSGTGDYYRQ